MPTITVTGACSTFTRLPGTTHSPSFALAAGLMTNTNRAGQELADVGPNFKRSYRARSVVSGTVSEDQRL